MTDLLLELFSEEIPARMQEAALEQLIRKLKAGLQEARLLHGEVKGYVTPRRLAVWVQELPAHQPDQTIERKGPKTSAPDAAIDGFCKSAGVTRDALEIRGAGKEATYYTTSEQKGLPTQSPLAEMIVAILNGFHWPKSMRWGEVDCAWVRPLRSILCVFGEEVVPLTWGQITAGNTTHGHRFMAPDPIVMTDAKEYETALEKAWVIADAGKRKARIRAEADALAASHGMRVRQDDKLLEEVTGLVEYPVPLMGTFDEAYLRLPPEVLVLEMRHHQKYFAVLDEAGEVTNRFITLANMQSKDGGAQITAGNERVIRARLEDGAFYFEQDRKKPLEEWGEGLHCMLFHKSLGTMAEKVTRISALSRYLSVFVAHADPSTVERAAALCKADLTTGMVGEFPELQGVMGRYYALAAGETEQVSDAVRDHYKPVGQGDEIPEAPDSVVIALVDKWDTLAGLFAAGEIPTGSKDPFALRRSALGILRIIRGHTLRLPLKHGIEHALRPFAARFDLAAQNTASQLYDFMMDRLKVALKEEGMRYDVVDAVFSGDHVDDVVGMTARGYALQTFLATAEGDHVLAAYKRASNILKKEEAKDGHRYEGNYDRDLIIVEMERSGNTYERDLVRALAEVHESIKAPLQNEAFAEAMQLLGTLRIPLDAFFTHVMVNDENPAIRHNRLHILAAIRSLIHEIADFSAIEG